MEKCNRCSKYVGDLRFGICFDCSSAAEEMAAKRSVIQHLRKCLYNLRHKNWTYAWYDFTWAWQRLTKTGDYEEGGTFDQEGYDWRDGKTITNNSSILGLKKSIFPEDPDLDQDDMPTFKWFKDD